MSIRQIPFRQAVKRPNPWRSINFDWLIAAAVLPGKTMNVACAIWYVASQQRSPTIKLPPYALKLFGVSRDCCYPALRRLEGASLIALDAGRGRTPTITLLDREAQPLALS